MASLGTLALDVIARTGPFEKKLKSAQSRTVGFAKSIKGQMSGSLRGFQGLLSSTTAQLGLFGGAAGLGGLAAFSIKSAADLETTKTQFETMLGSAEKADKIVSKLFDFSKVTPFEPEEIFGAGKGLLGAGFEEDEIMDPLRRLGDIAAGSGAELGDLVRIFGKVKATGKVGLETLNQFAERNAVSYNDLSKAMGVSTAEMTKMISAGEVGLPEMTAAIKMLTDEGGKFAGGMAAQSKTLDGLFSTLKGNMSAAAAELGAAAIGATDMKGALTGINEAMAATDWKAYGRTISDAFKEAAAWASALDGAVTSLQIGILGLQSMVDKASRPSTGIAEWFAQFSPTEEGAELIRRAGRMSNFINDDGGEALQSSIQARANALAKGRLQRTGQITTNAQRRPAALGPDVTESMKRLEQETVYGNSVLDRIEVTMRSIERLSGNVQISRGI